MKFLILLLIVLSSLKISAETWLVSPDSEYKYCSEVVNLVSDGDTIEIDNALYENDKQVHWKADNLFIRGVNGMPELKAGSKIENDNSNGKGIFVVQGDNTIIENIKFSNTKVKDHNGAGIRQEGSNLIVRYCLFTNNQNGILQGGTIDECKILIEYCIFKNSGSTDNPGYQHNIYINHIDTLVFRYNWTEDAIAEGHELKSRANNNFILYNYISNVSSVDSRNIDLPNGGKTIIMGNVIEQGQNSANSGIIGFGLEGLVNPAPHNLWIINNTIVNKKNRGNFFNVAEIDTFLLKNNICVGAKTGGFITGPAKNIDTSNNFISNDYYAPQFIDSYNRNYKLSEGSSAIDNGTELKGSFADISLTPLKEFVIPDTVYDKEIYGQIDIGAYEYVPTTRVISNDKKKNISIYPNPAREYIFINNFNDEIGNHYIEIFTLSGERILSKELSSDNIRINLSNIKSGYYIIKVDDEIHRFNKLK